MKIFDGKSDHIFIEQNEKFRNKNGVSNFRIIVNNRHLFTFKSTLIGQENFTHGNIFFGNMKQ